MAFDIFFGVLLLHGAFKGYRHGFANQMVHLTGLVLGFLLAQPLAERLAPAIGAKLDPLPAELREPLLFVAVIAAVWFAVTLIGSLVLVSYRTKVFGNTQPSQADRTVGVLLGVAKAGALIVVLAFFLNRMPVELRNSDLLGEQFRSSTGIELSTKVQLVERLMETAEYQNTKSHFARLIDYYRHANAPAARNASHDEPLTR